MRKTRVKKLRLQAKAEIRDLKEVKKEYLKKGKPKGRPFDKKSHDARLRRQKARYKKGENKRA